ncbi:hypothetical protein MMPV_001585 [Pyropia vietnamensis]
MEMDAESTLRNVSEYYGKKLQSSADLKTTACCPVGGVPAAHQAILKRLHPEVTARFYGCGSPIPAHISGCRVLDLGCGTGRDVFLASALVGPSGSVVGVDMTTEQLDVARRHVDYHAKELLGGAPSNVRLVRGVIESLGDAGIADASMDVVISNCVCNLSPNKRAVFAGVAAALAPGGEFYFSDIYADTRLSAEAQKHPVLVGECLGGALYFGDFLRIMADAGLGDVRVVSAAPVALVDTSLLPLVPGISFYSVTIRAFKLAPGVAEPAPEDYGQTATYDGSLEDAADALKLDALHTFPTGVAVPIDGNTAAVLQASRFAPAMTVTAAGRHRGLAGAPGGAEGSWYAAMAKLLPGIFDAPSTAGGDAATAGGGGCCASTAPDTLVAPKEKGCCPPAAAPAARAQEGCGNGVASKKGGCC